jgi:hypothetical protein
MMQSDSAARNGFTNRVCEFQNIDHSIASLHCLLQYNGVYSSYEEKRATVEDSVEDLIVSVPRIQMQLARILGGSADGYDAQVPMTNFGLDSLSTVELTNWVNRFVNTKITSTYFVGTSVSIDCLYAYMVLHAVSPL